jgi:urea transport system ATP-binding protein
MLRVEKLNQYYGESHTLWDVDLEVTRGQCTCLMGRNGVGKTTLLGCIMGLIAVHSGRILLDETEITRVAADRRARMGVGYVPQGRQIFPLLTVEENLSIGLTTGKQKLKRIPELVYEMFPVLEEMRGRLGGDLSGGQQQQLAIGRALVLQPSFLILDEPTEGIQPNIVQEIGAIIRRLCNEMSMTVFLVEQKLQFTRDVADRFTILDRGRVMASEPIDRLDEKIVQQYLTV